MSLPLTAALVAGLAVLVVVLSLCETVVAHTSKARAAVLADERPGRRRYLPELLARRQTNLAVLVVVRLAAQILGVVAVIAAAEPYRPQTVTWPVIVAITMGVAVTIEAVSKAVALERTD
ncbi:MAG: hypothetical protein ACLGIC_02530, partial [Acidimicrobiia bacterium]